MSYASLWHPHVKHVYYDGLVHQAWPNEWVAGAVVKAVILCIGFDRRYPQMVKWPLTCFICLTQEVPDEDREA